MRLLSSVALLMTLLVVGIGLSEQPASASRLWVATPTDFPPNLGTTAITASNASQVVQLAVFWAGFVNSVAFSPDGSLLAFNGDEDTIAIHRLPVGSLLHSLRGHTRNASTIAFTSDGALLASASLDTTVRLWNVLTGEEVAVLRGQREEISCMAISPDNTLLVSGSFFSDFTLRVWDLETRSQIRILSLEANGEAFTDVAFSPDGTLLAAGIASATGVLTRVQLWDVATWTPLIAFQDYSRAISDIAFSHDGTLLASGSQGGILYLWGMDAYQAPVMLHHFDETITSLDFSADDTLLAVALSDYTVRLWDLSEQREMVSLEGHTGLVSSVTFSPDGRLLASGSMYPDETARLWGIRVLWGSGGLLPR